MTESPQRRILAVDDNEETLDLISMTLSENFDVVTLKEPMEIYELINLFEPDLLILDIMMPKITGFQILDLLQKNPAYKDLPVIILSAKDTSREIKYGYKLGASLYLTKPFVPERLLRNVELLFEQKPQPQTPKTYNLKQVLVQIQLLKSFQNGIMKISSALLDTDELQTSKMRKAIEDVKKRQTLDRNDIWRG
ncbi:MAG TPA: response regulator [Candidatus Sumerlaeota bacterium]|nr:MAG: Response regulator MprA [candidate division BRC1 bacterium ADurb.Bin183]HQH12558.1 response regulator [Candidatus Sumerlaeota bacterium]